MSEPDRAWQDFTTLNQMLRNDELSAGERVEQLYGFVFESPESRHLPLARPELSLLAEWDIWALRRTYDLVEELIARYTARFHDPRVMDVTYYKRERRVRRHLDRQCSALFKELMLRSGNPQPPELVTEEPIYYLMQQAREKRFPRARDGRVSLDALRTRLHLELSKRIETGPDFRKVLLPHEIR